MGDRRKLQGEIDRCLKKVTEGVEIFEEIWNKVQTAPNHNQKDKYEQELKKEIKKLQRLRDQIKGWLSSPEIKDKSALQDARKQIEQEMERFKAVEREMKTKAYSNHGLDAGLKADPQEKEKEDCIHWITEGISELRIQIDKFEADIEAISATMKKRKPDRDKQERVEETKRFIERHKFHIQSLEKILRAIDNEAVDLKLVQDLRTDVEQYVNSNQDPDFKENDGMYDEIDMDNLTTIMAPVITPAPSQSHSAPSSSSSLSNGTNSSLTSNPLMDLAGSISNSHPNVHSTSERTQTTSSTHSNHPETELTTPSSTQPSSPSASPALSSTEEQKRTKFDSDDQTSQRKRSNSGTNGSMSNLSQTTSPKGSSSIQQKHSQSSTLPPFNHSLSTSATTTATATATSINNNPTVTTPPVIPYSAIVSQNALSSSATSTANAKQQPQLFSPPNKQFARQISTDNNGSTVTNSSSSVTSSSSSHPPSLLSTSTDRTNLTSQHSHNDLSQSTLSSTGSLANGPSLPASSSSSLFNPTATSASSRTNPNIPLELVLNNPTLDPSMTSQQAPLLSRILPDNDRSINPSTTTSTSTVVGASNTSSSSSSSSSTTTSTTGVTPSTGTAGIANGTSDSHSSLDAHVFSSLPLPSSSSSNPLPTASPFLPADPSPINGGVIGQLTDLHSNRYGFSSASQQQAQQSIVTTRVPLTTAEQRMLTRLNSAFHKLPSLLEAERQRINANRIYARNPLGSGQSIPYYPQVPPQGSDTPEFYYRLAPDTLFFVFYYMEGTRAQYLAAKALKRQSWRFHTKFMMWFQRHEEPKAITDDYEQGTYIYFDYERWQTRKRENFIFEYKFLEDREF